MTVIPETRYAHLILYLRLYCYCLFVSVLLLENQLSEGIELHLIDLTPSYCCACSKLGHAFPIFVVFSVLKYCKGEVIVRLIYVSAIADHHFIKFCPLFHVVERIYN